MKSNVENIRGIYLNRDETELSLEYSKYLTGNVTKSYLEAKDYSIANTLLTEVDYFAEIILDEDKNKTELVDNEIKNTYKYSPKYYYLVIKNNEIKLFNGLNSVENINDDEDLLWSFTFEGDFIDLVNLDGVVYILTSTKSYLLKRFNRVDKFNNSIKEIKLVEWLSEVEPIRFYLEKVDTYSKIERTKVLFHYEEENEIFFRAYDIDTEEYKYSFSYKRHYSNSGCSCWWSLVGNLGNIPEEIPRVFHSKSHLYDCGTDCNLCICDDICSDTNENCKTRIKALSGNVYSKTIEFDYDSNIGFNPDHPVVHYISTVMLDTGDEIPLMESKEETPMPHYYGLVIHYDTDLSTYIQSNPRVIAHRVYVKFFKDSPYELLFNHSFYSTDKFFDGAGKTELKGIYLTQTLGKEKLSDYNPVKTFDSITAIGNALLTTKGKKIYYPHIGNGQVTLTYYDYIPDIEGDLIFKVKDKLAIRDWDRIKFVNVSTESGLFIFTLIDETRWLIKDKYDIVETADGVILNTSEGIIGMDINNKGLLSEPINDVVRENWQNSNISYDVRDNVLFYFTNDNVYLFQLTEGVWRNTYLNPSTGKNRLIRLRDNDLILIGYTNSGYELKRIEFGGVPSVVKSHKYNLMRQGRVFKLTSINFDFEGKLEFNGKTFTNDYRRPTYFIIPVEERRYKDYIEFEFKLLFGKLYSYEVNFDTERKMIENTTQYEV